MKFFKTLYGKISLLFTALLLIMALVQAGILLQSAKRYVQESDQKLNHDLAVHLAEEFKPFLSDSIKYSDIQQTMHYLMVTNPRVEFYLLDMDGRILTFFADPEKVKRETVALAPIHKFFQEDASLPILGDDPRQVSGKKPFSIAKVQLARDKPGYLYVILGGEDYDSAASMVQNSYILRTSFWILVLVFAITSVVGLLLFALLTKKLNIMTAVVQKFERGHYSERISPVSKDELGQLSHAFNQMADTIVANMEELKQTDGLRRELVANISHDLRSPLASIQGYLETILMKNKTLSSDEHEKYLQILLRNTNMLNKLVGDLFELSKLDARQVEPQIEPFNMAELTQDVVMKFQPLAEEMGVQLKADLSKNLPGVKGDLALIERALSNLIENALRYTPKDGEVCIRLLHKNNTVYVSVSDTGPGIPAEDLPRIFERFYRLEKSRTSRQGAGLGLAIAQKIIELHNSSIQVESVLNKGTTFSFGLAGISRVA